MLWNGRVFFTQLKQEIIKSLIGFNKSPFSTQIVSVFLLFLLVLLNSETYFQEANHLIAINVYTRMGWNQFYNV